MRFKSVGNKGDVIAIVIQNNDATLSLFAGAPCSYVADAATGVKGASVKTVDSLAAAEGGLFAGFNLGNTSTGIGSYSESMVYGFYDYARVLLTTRSDASATWLSYSAIALGDIMSVVTTAGVQAVSRSGAGSATALRWNVIAAQTTPSFTTQASNTLTAGIVGNTTAMVTQLRVFVRAL